jgi:hypothetical protein
MLGNPSRKPHAPALEVLYGRVEPRLWLKGYYRAARSRALGLSAIETDVEPVGVDLGLQIISLYKREAQDVLVEIERSSDVLGWHPHVRYSFDHFCFLFRR